MTKKLTLVFLLTITVFCVSIIAISSVKTVHPEEFVVVIDAGHGGIDGGATGINTGIKESEIKPCPATQMKLEIIILSEVSQREKDRYYVISLI